MGRSSRIVSQGKGVWANETPVLVVNTRDGHSFPSKISSTHDCDIRAILDRSELISLCAFQLHVTIAIFSIQTQ